MSSNLAWCVDLLYFFVCGLTWQQKASHSSSATTSPTSSLPGTPRSQSLDLAPVAAPAQIALNTPDRKRIYASFTFTSPSPSAKRRVVSSPSSRARFSDSLFDSVAVRRL